MTSPLDTNVRGADPRNYGVAKRASLWVRPFGSSDDAAWDEIGNLADLSAVPDITKLEHKSNRRGSLVRDRIEFTERKMTLDVKLDEVKTSNLLKAFGSSIGKGTGTATVREGKIVKNPGAGGLVDLKMAAIDAAIVRSTNEEGSVTTYVVDPIATDSTETTASGDFNHVTDPMTVVGAVASYPAITFVVGMLLKIGSEILKVTAVVGNDVTFARAQLGTTVAAHADGVTIYVGNAKDYALDLTDGEVYILPGGALASATTVPEIHVYYRKDVQTESFQMFDGTPIKLEAEYQVLTTKGARIIMTLPNTVITNKGNITFGLGDKWIEMPLELDVLSDENGSLGYFHVIDKAAVL